MIPAVYGELRRVARHCMSGEKPGQTLQARPLTFEDAWSDLEQFDPRKAQIEEMPYFGGLTVEETAAALKISDRTVLREWETARVRLYRQLQHIRARGV